MVCRSAVISEFPDNQPDTGKRCRAMDKRLSINSWHSVPVYLPAYAGIKVYYLVSKTNVCTWRAQQCNCNHCW